MDESDNFGVGKRERRRLKREKVLGPERAIMGRSGDIETLECGHTLKAYPNLTKRQVPARVRRCVECVPGYDPSNPPKWNPADHKDVADPTDSG